MCQKLFFDSERDRERERERERKKEGKIKNERERELLRICLLTSYKLKKTILSGF